MSEDKAKNLLNQLSTIHVTQPCLVSGRMSFLWICPVLKKQWLMSCRLLHVQRLWDVSLPGFLLSSLLSLLKTECQLHSLSSSRNFNSHFFTSHSFFSVILLFHLPYISEGQSISTLEFSHSHENVLTWTQSCTSGQYFSQAWTDSNTIMMQLSTSNTKPD